MERIASGGFLIWSAGIAVVDAADRVVVDAQAHGSGSEQELLLPMLEVCADLLKPDTLITADAEYL
jgi:hypothetical protein